MKNLILIAAMALFLAPAASAMGAIDINTATAAQLDELAGIGPAYAQAIIGGRPFSSIDDLLRVKGIGEKTLQKIKEQGLACVNCGNSPPAGEAGALAPAGAGQTYPASVVINEIMPSPDGPDETHEWIELYNVSAQAIDLAGWQLRDTAGTTKTYSFSAPARIAPGAYMVIARPDTKIMLNDEQDEVELLLPNGNVVDSASYQQAPRAQSYSKTEDSWQWSAIPTPGAENILPKSSKFATNNAASLQQGSRQAAHTAAAALPADKPFAQNRKPAETSRAQFFFLLSGAVLIVCGAGALGYRYFLKSP